MKYKKPPKVDIKESDLNNVTRTSELVIRTSDLEEGMKMEKSAQIILLKRILPEFVRWMSSTITLHELGVNKSFKEFLEKHRTGDDSFEFRKGIITEIDGVRAHIGMKLMIETKMEV